MQARVIKGTQREIVDTLNRMKGVVREAIVFVEDANETNGAPSPQSSVDTDPLAEMDQFMVHRGDADDSRDAANRRTPGE